MLEIARPLKLTRRGFVVDFLVARSGGELWRSVSGDIRLINLNSWKTSTCAAE